MFPDTDYPKPVGSFPNPVTIPESDPLSGDQTCVTFSKAWLPYVLGCLMQLELSSTWKYATSDELALAKSYGDMLLDQFMKGGCDVSGLLIEACDDPDCGIKYSTDDGATWTCINLNDCIAAIVSTGIQTAIDNGLLDSGVKQQGPGTRPAPGVCHVYHVRLAPGSVWKCPSQVTAKDTIHITNADGAWSIGELPWWCPNGERYVFGKCNEGMKVHTTGDPLNPGAYHMALIGVIQGVYVDPLTAVYTVPDGTVMTDFFVQANTALTSDPSGEVTFDVTVCSNDYGWCWQYDFTVDEQGWDIHTCNSALILGGYALQNGFFTTIHSSYTTAEIHLTMPTGLTWDSIEMDFSNFSSANAHVTWVDSITTECLGHIVVDVSPGDSTVVIPASGIGIYVELYINWYTDSGTDPVYLHRIRFKGNPGTTNVFSGSNC